MEANKHRQFELFCELELGGRLSGCIIESLTPNAIARATRAGARTGLQLPGRGGTQGFDSSSPARARSVVVARAAWVHEVGGSIPSWRAFGGGRFCPACFFALLPSAAIYILAKVLNSRLLLNCKSPYRLVVRTSRRGRDNPGSTPGAVICSMPTSVL